jgi:hypothetical protein
MDRHRQIQDHAYYPRNLFFSGEKSTRDDWHYKRFDSWLRTVPSSVFNGEVGDVVALSGGNVTTHSKVHDRYSFLDHD